MMSLSTAAITSRFRRQHAGAEFGISVSLPNPETVVREQVAAFNRHDLDATLALFTADCTWELVGRGQTLNRDALGLTIWRFFHHDAQIAVRSLAGSGDTVIGEFVQTYRDDDRGFCLSAPTVCAYTVVAGRIARVRQYFDPSWERAATPSA
jgi:hypothetical protein